MDGPQVLLRCQQIIHEAGFDDADVRVSNFLDYTDFVRDIIREWPAAKRQGKQMREFVRALRQMRDNLAVIVEQDPLALYKPAHHVALEFHQSTALIRYFRGGNRISKTQSADAEIYWVTTGQHPYRLTPRLPADFAVVSYSYAKYAPRVFEPKFVTGEGGNPLSPIFPEGGKWFNRYDSVRKIITIACPECAKAGRPGACRHPKSTITLFSEREGPKAMPGAAYAGVHFDEQVPYAFLPECLKRMETVPHSGLIATETPLGGKGFWTHRVLTRDARAEKMVPGTTQRLVTLHTIDQFAAGLADHDKVRASMELMSPAEVEARVYGRPAAYSESGVFDAFELNTMHDDVREPARGMLVLPDEEELGLPEAFFECAHSGEPPRFIAAEDDTLRVWDPPEPFAQYVIGGDVAQGLIHGDASCASVVKMSLQNGIIALRLVAQLHGWINPQHFAQDCFRLAVWYNSASLVIERNGPGHEVLRNLREWGYWNLFRDVSDPAQVVFAPDAAFGVDTTVRTKATMVSILQQQVKDRRTGRRALVVPCADTLEEMGSFGQESTDSGLTIRFRGDSGMPDDRVMSLVVGVYAAMAFGLFDFQAAAKVQPAQAEAALDEIEREAWAAYRRRLAEEREEGSEAWGS